MTALVPAEPQFCPRGCKNADDCRGSIAIPCARNLWDLGETGRFQILRLPRTRAVRALRRLPQLRGLLLRRGLDHVPHQPPPGEPSTMRQKYDDDTIAVELTVRHTHSTGTVERRHELVVKVGSDGRPEWLNRRIVAAVDAVEDLIAKDFNITERDIELGLEEDWVAPR